MASTPSASRKAIVCFVYRKPKWGSTILRVFQLSKIVNRYLGEECEVRLHRLPSLSIPGAQYLWAKAMPAEAHYFFSKSCLPKLSEAALDLIRRKAATVCFDHVDGDLRTAPRSGCDFHICTSYAQEDAVKRLTTSGEIGPGEPLVILHNNDLRFEDLPPAPQTAFRTLYLGLGQNLVLPDSLRPEVDVYDLGAGVAFEDVIPKLPDYTFHYGVRPPPTPGLEVYKPFLKGFLAAKFGANIAVHRDTDDAARFLGSDYPYLVDDFLPETVGKVLMRARDGFGGPEWCNGVEIMRELAQKVTSKAIAMQFKNLFSNV